MSGHAADPDTIAGTSLPNTRNAAVVPGKRAAAAMLAINRATERTVERINLEAMEQSFPDFLESEEDRQFVKLLTEKTVEHLKAGFKVSIHNLLRLFRHPGRCLSRACKQQD